ncbi:hypothetical protein [Cellulomonas sp.]|uniref:hypothetical protein n=1 Tax=Cellulomonas sp. TaxID=40001 RepID=UPI003BAAAA7F
MKKLLSLLAAMTIAAGLAAGGAAASQASRADTTQMPSAAQSLWCKGPVWCWY